MIKHDYTENGDRVENSTILKNMHRRIIKNFLDILVLAELRDGPLSGYDVMTFINSKFRLLVSSGTVYSLLYSLERDGLIIGTWYKRKRMYRLTEKGKENIKAIVSVNEKIQHLVSSLLKLSN